MKKPRWSSKWLILPLIVAELALVLSAGFTMASFQDAESSNASTTSAWTSTQWTQTSQVDFEAGVPTNVNTTSSPGNMVLPSVNSSFPPSGNTGNWTNPANAYSSNNQYATFAASAWILTNSPTANTGSAWTNPNNAYADDANFATITSGTPSGSNIWGTYGFSLAGYDILQVRVRYDAWSAGYSAGATSQTIRPTGDDSNTCAATRSTGTTFWELVDETSYSDADYYTMVTNGGGHLTVSGNAFSIPAGATISNVTIYYRGNNGGTASFRPSLKIGATYYDTLGTVRDPAAWTTYSDVFTTNPKTGVAWTVSDLNRSGGDLNNYLNAFGTASTDCNPDNQISWLYIVANYTPATEYDDQIRVDVSWDGGSTWSITQNTTLTSSETTYWYDVTSATTWTPTKLDDTNLKVRALAYTQGSGAEVVRLDWLPVEVTYTTDASTWSHTYTTYGISLPGYTISSVEVGFEAYAASSEQLDIEVSWDGGTSWSSKQRSSALGSSDPNTITWFDFTSATSWTPTTLNDANFEVRIWYVSSGAGGTVSLDYLPTRVVGRVTSGTIASQVLDTTVTGSQWDGLFWDSTLPAGTNITFENRASDTSFLKDAVSPSWTAVGSISASTSIVTNSPTANTGAAWTNPNNAYADDTSYATITSGNPSGSNVWGTYGFDLTGKTITQVKVRYDAWHGTLGSTPTWASPTSDVANGWSNPTFAYNGNTGDAATISVAGASTSAYLELYISTISCDKVRVWSGRSGTRINAIDVDVYYNSQWNNIYSGALVVDSYQEYSIGSTQTVSGMRIRYTSSANPAQTAYIYEAQFNSFVTNSAPQIKIDVSWDGGSSWSSTQDTTLSASETTYWYDVTSATTWDATKLNNTNLKVRALAQTVYGDVEVRLDWLPIEVTYYTGSTGSISITNGTGRYKQWRATLTTSVNDTPTLQEVRVYYYGP